MAQGQERFAYFDFINGLVTRFLPNALILIFGLSITFGDNAYQSIGRGHSTIEADYSIFTQITGYVLIIFGCMGIFWAWRRATHSSAVVLTLETISAPCQGAFGHTVEIPFIEITELRKHSIDGRWEFKIISRDNNIRVTKDSFKISADFDKIINSIQRYAPNCELEIKVRVDPPYVESGSY